MDSPLLLGGRDGTAPVESKSTETPRLPASVLSGSNKETDARFIRAVRESGGKQPRSSTLRPAPRSQQQLLARCESMRSYQERADQGGETRRRKNHRQDHKLVNCRIHRPRS